MAIQNRRQFLSALGCSLVTPRFPVRQSTPSVCWLEVAAPFVLDDAAHGMQSDIVLTSDTFVGTRGYADGADATEYEIWLV